MYVLFCKENCINCKKAEDFTELNNLNISIEKMTDSERKEILRRGTTTMPVLIKRKALGFEILMYGAGTKQYLKFNKDRFRKEE